MGASASLGVASCCAGKSQAPIAEAGTFVSDWGWLPCKTTRGLRNRLVKAEKKYGSPRINAWEDVTRSNYSYFLQVDSVN
jgi:hypothetical protein